MGAFRTSGYDKVLLNLRSMVVELAEALQNHLSAAIQALEKGETIQDWEERDDVIDQLHDSIING